MSAACSNSSPRTHRASRPLSAVFQSLQPPSLWKTKKGSSSLSQVDYNPIYFCRLKLAFSFSITNIGHLHFINLLRLRTVIDKFFFFLVGIVPNVTSKGVDFGKLGWNVWHA